MAINGINDSTVFIEVDCLPQAMRFYDRLQLRLKTGIAWSLCGSGLTTTRLRAWKGIRVPPRAQEAQDLIGDD